MISGTLAVLAVLVPPFTWFICQKKKTSNLVGFVSTCILVAALHIGASYVYGLELESEMYRFDLNADKEFSQNELTDEARAAIEKWSGDSGRMFSPIVAPVVSLVWTSVIFASFHAIARFFSVKQS